MSAEPDDDSAPAPRALTGPGALTPPDTAPPARDLTPRPAAAPSGEPAAPGPDPRPAPSGGTRTWTRARARTRTPARARRRTAVALTAVAAAAAVTAAVLTARGGSGAGASDAAEAKDRPPGAAAAALDGLPHTAVDVSTGTCGRGWTRPRTGRQVFDLHNSGTAAGEVYLTDPATGEFYAEVEGLAPGATRPMRVDLGSGTYAFMCVQEDTDAVRGPSVTVPGTAPRGPAALPVTEHDLIPPTLAYQRWIGARAAELAHGTGVLKADIDRGDLAAARRDWLTAHLVYERMGAAYGTFGAADSAVNGIAAQTPGAVRDPSFTGFHRVEYGLWHGEPAASLRGATAQLDTDVRALRDGWPQQRIAPADLGLRAHEILENTLQFELTGRTDYGSGSSLATARANIDGTREILARLRPLLRTRLPALPRLDATLATTAAALDAQHHGAAWTPLARLPRDRRERIDADFGAALEQLARVAAIFDVRRTA